MSKKNSKDLLFPVLLPYSAQFRIFPWLSAKLAGAIIAVLAVVCYAPSVNNEYALDDGIIIHQNDHVLKGIKGIKGILTLDAYESFYRRMCATDQLAGGRYRPLSVVSFALEQELLGAYRSGLYLRVDDANKNGILDPGKVDHVSPCGRPEKNFEYNESIDRNGDGLVQGNECPACWDRNRNFANDRSEDLNDDGLFNEMDCQLYGATLRHFNNIWLYALGCLLLYLVFSRCFFRPHQDLAFVAALLFTLHPIHSEAVANVKSRDELFSLIFICLTFLYAFRFVERRSTKDALLCGLHFLLALLSKEYAVMMLALVPLSFWFFTTNNLAYTAFVRSSVYRQSLLTVLGFIACAAIMTYIKRDFDMHALPGARPVRSYWLLVPLYGAFTLSAGIFKSRNINTLLAVLCLVMLVYVGMRWNAVRLKPGVPDNEILNNPYLLADGEERFCTKAFVLLKYLQLLIFPRTLAADYSFNTILYRNFASWDFWLSILIHAALLAAAVFLARRRHVLGFAICTYFLFLLMIANVLMDIGATMGERLVFHASIGFCIATAFFIIRIPPLPRLRRLPLFALLVACILFSVSKNWERSLDWKNDITLFLKDAKTHPNSVLCLGNAGARYVDLLSTEDFSVTTPPGYDTGFNDQNGTLSELMDEVKAGIYPGLREAAINHGIAVLNHAIELHPRYVNGYLNRGLLHFQLRHDFEALFNWKVVEKLYPNNPYLTGYRQAFAADLQNRAARAYQRGRWDSVAVAYNLMTILEPFNAAHWQNLGGAYFNQQRFDLARKSWNRALALQPGNAETARLLKMLPPLATVKQ